MRRGLALADATKVFNESSLQIDASLAHAAGPSCSTYNSAANPPHRAYGFMCAFIRSDAPRSDGGSTNKHLRIVRLQISPSQLLASLRQLRGMLQVSSLKFGLNFCRLRDLQLKVRLQLRPTAGLPVGDDFPWLLAHRQQSDYKEGSQQE